MVYFYLNKSCDVLIVLAPVVEPTIDEQSPDKDDRLATEFLKRPMTRKESTVCLSFHILIFFFLKKK